MQSLQIVGTIEIVEKVNFVTKLSQFICVAGYTVQQLRHDTVVVESCYRPRNLIATIFETKLPSSTNFIVPTICNDKMRKWLRLSTMDLSRAAGYSAVMSAWQKRDKIAGCNRDD